MPRPDDHIHVVHLISHPFLPSLDLATPVPCRLPPHLLAPGEHNAARPLAIRCRKFRQSLRFRIMLTTQEDDGGLEVEGGIREGDVRVEDNLLIAPSGLRLRRVRP
jgi:hypothetical protein